MGETAVDGDADGETIGVEEEFEGDAANGGCCDGVMDRLGQVVFGVDTWLGDDGFNVGPIESSGQVAGQVAFGFNGGFGVWATGWWVGVWAVKGFGPQSVVGFGLGKEMD